MCEYKVKRIGACVHGLPENYIVAICSARDKSGQPAMVGIHGYDNILTDMQVGYIHNITYIALLQSL